MWTHFEAKNKLFRFSWQVLFSAISETGNFRGILVVNDWVVVSNIVYFHPYLGKWSNLTNIFQMGWNHQLDDKCHLVHSFNTFLLVELDARMPQMFAPTWHDISLVRFGAGYRATMEDLSGQWLRGTIYQLKQLKIATSICGLIMFDILILYSIVTLRLSWIAMRCASIIRIINIINPTCHFSQLRRVLPLVFFASSRHARGLVLEVDHDQSLDRWVWMREADKQNVWWIWMEHPDTVDGSEIRNNRLLDV